MIPRILVIRFSSLGDILLTAPTVLNLRLAYPEAHLTFLTKDPFRELVSRFEGVDEVLAIPGDSSALEYITFLLTRHDHQFTHLIDLHANARSLLARKLLSGDHLVIYPKRRTERQAMVRRHHKVLPETPTHTIDAYNQTVRALQGKVVADRPLFSTGDLSNGSIDNPSGRPLVVIAPGAAHEPKQYGLERLARIAAELQSEAQVHIVWATTAGERSLADLNVQLDSDRTTELVDHSLVRLAEIISTAALTIANDSGIAHLSSAVGTPVIALFGPTHPALGFAPRGQFDRVLQVEEFCRPCSLHGKVPCFREEQYCFTRIAEADVIDTARDIMRTRADLRPALFVDRDGTLIKEKHFLKDPEQVEFETGALDTLRRAGQKGYRLVILSNQSGVARGKMTTDHVDAVNARMIEMLAAQHIEIDGLYYCPYHPEGSVRHYATVSRDRKPAPGMVETAAEQLKINSRRSIIVGDKRSDLHLAAVVGARGCLVRTGYGAESELNLSDWERRRFDVRDNLGEITDLL